MAPDEKSDRFSWAALLGTVVFAALFIGTVTVWIPQQLSGGTIAPALFPFARWLGVLLIALALPVMLAFLIRFVTEGRGTPAPFAPPSQLVVGGLFRRVRNPGYLGAVALVAGQGLILGAPRVLLYAAFLALVFHLFVLFYEEPTLRHKFGADYERYCREVPRWIPRWR